MRNLEFDPKAFDDLAWWIEQDRKKALQIGVSVSLHLIQIYHAVAD